jgi:archaellum biogenesis ATPase FlaH
MKELFNKPKIIGVCGDVNNGKSMLLYHMLETLADDHKFKLYTYGLRLKFGKSRQIYSVAEMEQIRNSIIIIDELSSLFDLDNRKVKKLIENSLRLINHNNNILVICGTPENFKKFISAKLDYLIMKKTTLSDCINGSRLKNIITNYKGNERGSEVLNLRVEEALIFDGMHYEKIDVPYYQKYDSKSENVPILVSKNVQKTCKKKKV